MKGSVEPKPQLSFKWAKWEAQQHRLHSYHTLVKLNTHSPKKTEYFE